jgi:hypothetical protein
MNETSLELAPEPQTEHTVVRIVVCGLVAVVVLGMAAMTWLIAVGTDAAKVALLSSPTTTALGALTAMLVSTRSIKPPAPPAVTVHAGTGASPASGGGGGTSNPAPASAGTSAA